MVMIEPTEVPVMWLMVGSNIAYDELVVAPRRAQNGGVGLRFGSGEGDLISGKKPLGFLGTDDYYD